MLKDQIKWLLNMTLLIVHTWILDAGDRDVQIQYPQETGEFTCSNKPHRNLPLTSHAGSVTGPLTF